MTTLRTTRRATDPNVGDLFVSIDDRDYTENGRKGVHHTEVVYEITALTHSGFTAAAVNILSETGRPSFASTPRGTSMAWFGWDRAVKQGRIRLTNEREI